MKWFSILYLNIDVGLKNRLGFSPWGFDGFFPDEHLSCIFLSLVLISYNLIKVFFKKS